MVATKNLLSPLGFKLILQRIPNVAYFVQNVPLPVVSIATAIQPTPFTNVTRPGDKVTFDPLNLTFLVDEDMTNLIEIFNWSTSIARATSFQEIRDFGNFSSKDLTKPDNLVSDGSIAIQTNNFNPNVELRFKDMFPTQLSPPTLDTTASGETILTASVTFAYSTYEIARVR